MPTVTLTRQVFPYRDLSPDAQQRIRESDGRFHEWERWNCEARITDSLEAAGLGELDHHYSLGYCQGDGCSVSGNLDAADLIDDGDWVDCWAGTPERTLGADLDPERLTVMVEASHQSFCMTVTVDYDCAAREDLDTGCLNYWQSEYVCGDPLCPTDAERDAIAAAFKERIEKACNAAYRDIYEWCLEDRVDDLTEFFDGDWFYEDGSPAPEPGTYDDD